MFAECDSPSLIEMYSSCDIKVRLFYDLNGGKTGHVYSEIIQVFDLYQMSRIYFNIKAGTSEQRGQEGQLPFLPFARRGKGGRSAL